MSPVAVDAVDGVAGCLVRGDRLHGVEKLLQCPEARSVGTCNESGPLGVLTNVYAV